MPLMTLAEIKGRLRAGEFAWPGGYQCYFIATDGEALSFDAVREGWSQVVRAHLTNDRHCGFGVVACEINYEDTECYCAHTGKRIPPAYGDD